ncbi:MAG: sensor histidine kinase [Sphingobacteriaceae bacterium]
MKKRSIGLIVGLMGFALMGVMAMQLYFLRQSYHMQSELFDRSVNEALNNVVTKIEKQDALNFLQNKVRLHADKETISKEHELYDGRNSTSKLRYKNTADRKRRIATLQDSLNAIKKQRVSDQEQKLADLDPKNSEHVQIRVEQYQDEFGRLHQNIRQQVTALTDEPAAALQRAKHVVEIYKYDTLRYLQIDPLNGPQVVSVPRINPLWLKEQERKRKEKVFTQVKKLLEAEDLSSVKEAATRPPTIIEDLADEYQKAAEPLNKRINLIWIDTLLRGELFNKGVFLPFSYEVSTSLQDSLIFSKALDVSGERPVFIPVNTYQTLIFNKDLISDPGKIRITFPQKNTLILTRMTAGMATSGALLVVLVFCFGYTLFSILKQKKISEMKTDFINNMTHEFKTPVSTIMIASEALKDVEMAHDKNRVFKLANIIYEENLRLGSHIERVLNIARIEQDDFKLDIKTVDVNDLILAVIDSMALKLQKHDAKVTLELQADHPFIEADELHFSNVVYNLIDNAIKYSQESPKINVRTQYKNKQLLISVADQGIGMNKEQQSKIFEQFYRIPTGNLHDVKGFGLGLSYVNTIVKRLNGSISVKSEKDKGSEFEMRFVVN